MDLSRETNNFRCAFVTCFYKTVRKTQCCKRADLFEFYETNAIILLQVAIFCRPTSQQAKIQQIECSWQLLNMYNKFADEDFLKTLTVQVNSLGKTAKIYQVHAHAYEELFNNRLAVFQCSVIVHIFEQLLLNSNLKHFKHLLNQRLTLKITVVINVSLNFFINQSILTFIPF